MSNEAKEAKKAKNTVGVLGQFETAGELYHAAEKTRDAGYTKFDCHSPFPIHGMDKAMGLKRSMLGWIVGMAAIIGTSGGFLLQWWTSTTAYPLIISGKPLNSYPAFVPVAFGVGVLLSAFAALFGMLALNGLPRFHHPVFYSNNFAKFSNNGFFLSIESNDSKFDENSAREFLGSIGGKNIETLNADD